MSYNCDMWKTKLINNFKIPIASLYKHHRDDWHPERINNDDGSVIFEIGETKLHGIIENEWLVVKSIKCTGEGSGTAMDFILEPAFEDSVGELIASLIWEKGDTINELTVKDGKVSWENIEI